MEPLAFLSTKLTLTSPSAMLQQALEIYNNTLDYQNESARTTYKLGCVKLEAGESESGAELIRQATEIYRRIVPSMSEYEPDEKDFDMLIMSLSR